MKMPEIFLNPLKISYWMENYTYEIEEALGLVFKKNNADVKSQRKKNIRVKGRK
jgi:hypothetical protein